MMMMHRYLTGNPGSDHEGYRDYVIATLPQLQVCSLKSKSIQIIGVLFLEIGWK